MSNKKNTITRNVYICGWNASGRIGLGMIDTGLFHELREHTYLKEKFIVKSIHAGEEQSFFIANGSVYACGSGADYCLGIPTEKNYYYPTKVEAFDRYNIVQISSSIESSHGIALDAEGRVFVWGNNSFGQLGIGSDDKKCEVRIVPPELFDGKRPTLVCAGSQTSFVATDSSLFGAGLKRRIGVFDKRTPGNVNTFLRVEKIQNLKIRKIQSHSHTCVLTYDGEVYIWGDDTNWQAYSFIGTPTKVCEGIKDIAVGNGWSLFLQHNGAVFGIGDLSKFSNYTSRMNGYKLVYDRIPIQKIYGGHDFAAFITHDGRVLTAGDNSKLQLGRLGSDTREFNFTKPLPFKVGQIALGKAHMIILESQNIVIETEDFDTAFFDVVFVYE